MYEGNKLQLKPPSSSAVTAPKLGQFPHTSNSWSCSSQPGAFWVTRVILTCWEVPLALSWTWFLVMKAVRPNHCVHLAETCQLRYMKSDGRILFNLSSCVVLYWGGSQFKGGVNMTNTLKIMFVHFKWVGEKNNTDTNVKQVNYDMENGRVILWWGRIFKGKRGSSDNWLHFNSPYSFYYTSIIQLIFQIYWYLISWIRIKLFEMIKSTGEIRTLSM